MSVWLAQVLEVLFWWGACLGIWLLSLSAISGQELLVSVIVSLPCGVAALGARLAARGRWGLSPEWVRGLAVLPVAIVSDTVQVIVSVVRSPGRKGEFVRIPITDGSGQGPRPSGRRAVATFLTTLTPSSIVTDIDPESGEALVHVIEVAGPRMERMAAR